MFLKDRQLQIAYIKKRNPELAALIWQDKRPYNLYNYQNPNALKTFSYKVRDKLKRSIKSVFGKPYNQRNWELQFLGDENRKHLETVIKNLNLNDLLPKTITESYVHDFYNGNTLQNAHALKMLLVLAKFNQTQRNG